MPNLDYGYEITIAQNATSDPASASVTNQWQIQMFGNTIWEDIAGATGETYVVQPGDRWAKIRLQQTLDGIKAYSNQLQVTYDEYVNEIGIEEIDIPDGPSGIGYDCCIVGVNGDLYSLPSSYRKIFVFDPITETGREIEGLPYSGNGGAIAGAVFHPNGRIYTVPFHASFIVEIDTATETISYWGSLSNRVNKFAGCVLGLNGKMYAIPYQEDKVVEVDVENRTHRQIGSTISSSQNFNCGVLAPNGKIYSASRNPTSAGSAVILEIDPDTARTALISHPYGGGWRSGALAPNGKIYYIPNTGSNILILDPNTNTVSTISIKRNANNNEWSQAVLAPNGIIYGIPGGSSDLMEIDTNVDKAKYTSVSTSWQGWYTGALAPNGRIYSAPGYKTGSVMSLGVGSPPAKGLTGSEYWDVPGLPDDKLDPRAPYFNKP